MATVDEVFRNILKMVEEGVEPHIIARQVKRTFDEEDDVSDVLHLVAGAMAIASLDATPERRITMPEGLITEELTDEVWHRARDARKFAGVWMELSGAPTHPESDNRM